MVSVSQTNATMKLDSSNILVGDQTGLEIRFEAPATFEVKWPDLHDTLTSEIEIIKKSKKETIQSDDKTSNIHIQKLTITSFDSGYYAIPPIQIQFRKTGDSVWSKTETAPVLLGVNSVPVNLEGEIKDIKPPENAPFTFREALPYILIFIGVALATLMVIWYLRKRKKAEPIFRVAPKPQLPPHQIALDALESLRFKKLWQNGHIKAYHTELTDIIREYLHGKFAIQAQEYTSDEIMDEVNNTAANTQAKDKLRQTLALADMVKFAKMQPLPLEHDASLNNAIDFVKETIHLGNNPENQTAVETPQLSENKLPLDEAGKEVNHV